MNKDKAIELAEEYLGSYRKLGYADLRAKLGTTETFEGVTQNGEGFQVEIDFSFDDEKAETIRITALVSYSIWTDFAPITSDFIVAQDGSFIGE